MASIIFVVISDYILVVVSQHERHIVSTGIEFDLDALRNMFPGGVFLVCPHFVIV